jgi:transcriptional regulator with XRE-family HTH domain
MRKDVKILMTQQEIAEATGRTQPFIHYILKGDRSPSISFSTKLEEATGICREAWMFPERHWNPYIPFNDLIACITCPNRPARIKKSIEMSEIHFEQAENKREAFKGLVEIKKTYTGIKNVVFIWREIVPEGLKLLACTERDDYQTTPELLPNDSFKRLYQWALDEQSIVIPHFPYDISKSWAEEINLFFKMKLKSMLSIARDDLFFCMYSQVFSMNWTDSGIKDTEKHVERISKIWKQYKKTN